MADRQKRKRADRARARREAEEARRKRDDERYETFLRRQEAGEQPGVIPIPTCCPCFDNCGECTSDVQDLRRQLSISVRALEEEFARLFPNGLDKEMMQQIIEDPEWHLAPREISTPQTSPHGHTGKSCLCFFFFSPVCVVSQH